MLVMQLPLGIKRAIFLSGMSGCEALLMHIYCAKAKAGLGVLHRITMLP